eukprot:TRINITY_DN11053_c1_g1_i6.p1 TRINITY_DN11053_c1_g1~~TRINITY_DN11053_c1_g1_i6.p1  ORF type:complete len:548 (+),score=124.78 TRINITY_DN11053_c1_g1_i6:194-1645(+)
MPEVSAIVLLRADLTSLATLQAELQDPKYKEYRLYFTSPLADTDLELLAEADIKRVVTTIEEVYVDVFPIDRHVFSCEAMGAFQDPTGLSGPFLRRTVHGLTSLLKGLKLSPQIRYQANSPQCVSLADAMFRETSAEDPDTVLLLLDRRDDLVTPCLLPWTYQALIHDVVGIENGRLDPHSLATPKLPRELRLKPFSPFHDAFLRQSRFAPWPDVLKMQTSLSKKYQQQKAMQEGVKQGSLADMKSFLLNFDAYEGIRDAAELHLGLLTSLGQGFFDRRSAAGVVDMLEEQTQTILDRRRKASMKQVDALLTERGLQVSDKLRLAMLHAIKHNDTAEAEQLASSLRQAGASGLQCQAVTMACTASQSGQPGVTGECFKQIASMTYQPQAEAELELYVFQHTPLLASRLKQLEKGSLSTKTFPWRTSGGSSSPKRMIAFVIGGVTYEESKLVHSFNTTTSIQALLGGTHVHNLASLCEELKYVR